MSRNIIRTINDANQNYKRYSGVRADSFICPISFKETSKGIIDGHIIPKAWNISNITTPQLKDIDSFFGHSFQHKTTAIQRAKKIIDNEDPSNLIMNLSYLARDHKCSVWLDSESSEIYKANTKKIESIPQNHTSFDLKDDRFVIKAPPSAFADMKEHALHVDILANGIDSYFATLLHSAHLTMFYFLGYKYALSDSGMWCADTLYSLYQERSNPDKLKSHCRELVTRHAHGFSGLTPSREMNLESTLISGTAFACSKPNEPPFGLMLIIKDSINCNGILLPWIYHTPTQDPVTSFHRFLDSGENEFNIFLVKFGNDSSLTFINSPCNGERVQINPNAKTLIHNIDLLMTEGFSAPDPTGF